MQHFLVFLLSTAEAGIIVNLPSLKQSMSKTIKSVPMRKAGITGPEALENVRLLRHKVYCFEKPTKMNSKLSFRKDGDKETE